MARQDIGKFIFQIEGKKAEVHFNSVDFSANSLGFLDFRGGRVFIDNTRIRRIYTSATPISLKASNSIFHDANIHFEYPNSKIAKKAVHFNHCLISEKARFGIACLWSMKDCDIYGKPFRFSVNWKKASSIKNNLYFDQKGYVAYIGDILKKKSRFKPKISEKPINDHLSLEHKK